MLRDIDDILNFRRDISPFLVHLTKAGSRLTPEGFVEVGAREVLKSIIAVRQLVAGKSAISDARWAYSIGGLGDDERREFFGATCFTETPISEIHCLLDIDRRQVELEPYGLVFLKEHLAAKGVSPVFYLNNCGGDMDQAARALAALIDSDPQAARRLLPLVSLFGEKLKPVGGTSSSGKVDFRWEREWRFPASLGNLKFKKKDVFMGVCPHQYINEFEELFPGVGFIDPRRTMSWYATKLIDARQRLDLKQSVV